MADPEPRSDAPDDLPQTSAADVESAGRSCMVIILLGVVIVAVVLIWIGLTALGVID